MTNAECIRIHYFREREFNLAFALFHFILFQFFFFINILSRIFIFPRVRNEKSKNEQKLNIHTRANARASISFVFRETAAHLFTSLRPRRGL